MEEKVLTSRDARDFGSHGRWHPVVHECTSRLKVVWRFLSRQVENLSKLSPLVVAQRAADVMFAGSRAGLDVLPAMALCGCWWPVYPEVMCRRAGDEVLG